MRCRRVVHEAIRRNQEGTASTALTADALGTNPIHDPIHTEPRSMNGSNGRGYLELNDAGGSKMVEAGSLATGKGYVLVTPWTASVTPGGDPSVLRGGKKK